MITITLTADTFEELQRQAILALGLKPPLRPFSPEPVPAPPEIKPTAAERKKQEARDKLRGGLAARAKAPEIDPVDEMVENAHVGADIDNGPATNEIPFEIDIGGMPSPDQHEDEPEYVEVPVPSGDAPLKPSRWRSSRPKP